jgi:ribosomal protein L15
MRLPKRGFVNNLRKEIEVVNIRDLVNLIESKKINSQSEVTKEQLENLGLIKNKKSVVKLIMGKSKIDLHFKVLVDKYSKNAQRFS